MRPAFLGPLSPGYWIFDSEIPVVISPELVIEVEARMNRQYTPPSLIPGTSAPSTSMSMNNCVGVPPNTQARTTTRSRRTGLANLATVNEGPGPIYKGISSIPPISWAISRIIFRLE